MDQRAAITEREGRWARRPVVAFGLRALATAAPLLVSVAAVFVASRSIARPAAVVTQLAWWAGLLALGTVALVVTDRFARRLLPLAALLRLSIVFPDAAPTRFSVALRAGTVRKLTRASASSSSTIDLEDASPAAQATAELARLVSELHTHDRRTRGHAERVRAYTQLIATELGISAEERNKLEWAALLHDVGKLTVPTSILNKPGRLDDEEFAIIRGHPGAGAELIGPLRWWLGPWADAVGQHHERFDGGGYPDRLAGAEISLGGRIVAVADAFDVMTAARSYKKPQEALAARAELTRCAGSHFDPVVVRAFLSLSIGRIRATMGPLSWLANIPVLGSAATAPVAGSAIGAAAATALGASIVVLPPLIGGQTVAGAGTAVAIEVLPAAPEATTTTAVEPAVSAWSTDWSGGPPISPDEAQAAPVPGIVEPPPTTEVPPAVPTAPPQVATTTGPPVVPPTAAPPVAEPPADPPTTAPPTTLPAVIEAAGPQAVDDLATVGGSGFVNIRVVRNDVDRAGSGLAVAAFTPGELGGSVSDNGNGTLRYVPAAPAGSIDRFTYVVRDGLGHTATATVTVTIR